MQKKSTQDTNVCSKKYEKRYAAYGMLVSDLVVQLGLFKRNTGVKMDSESKNDFQTEKTENLSTSQ